VEAREAVAPAPLDERGCNVEGPMNAAQLRNDLTCGQGSGRHVDMPTMHFDRSIAERHDRRRAVRLLGDSVAWRGVLKSASQVAATDTTTCVLGESGTGKELIARYIHLASPRRRRPFIAINCAALPDSLVESELFGYERGAFTGADRCKPGQIELAAGGVLFLDEIAELTPTAQAKILRVLQEQEFVRIGGTRAIRADVRVIAATNQDLHEAVARGRFRSDLYYRVNVFEIYIQPLRERRDDILVLAAGLLRELARVGNNPTLTREAVDALVAYDWPGNVRELRNVIERATIVCENGLIRVQDLSFRPTPPCQADQASDLHLLEQRAIARVLREVKGNKARAARQLGITRMQLYGRLRKHRLEATG
jgi:Nif-specific regulatory protein